MIELIRDTAQLAAQQQGCVATLGNFDGVHLGHQRVLTRLVTLANATQLPSVVLTTEPTSGEYFATTAAPARLTPLRDKLDLLAGLGVDKVLCLRFNQRLANLNATEFVKTILCQALQVKHLVIGDDTRFGKNRQGDFKLLTAMGEQKHFTVEQSAGLLLAGERVSSTRIRATLAQGDFALAERLLGRPYTMSGRVAHGDKRGRCLGYPTANIALKRRQSPLHGVFVVTVDGLTKTALPGVASLGIRPTFGGKQWLLEVHLLDFNQSIYRRRLNIRFLDKLREEQMFTSQQQLIAQMDNDTERARAFFANA